MQQSKQDRETERAHARHMLQQLIPDRRTIIHTRTEYTRGQTDYVKVYVVKQGRIFDASYYVARAAGLKVTDRGIALKGGQYSKALEVADWAWRTRFDGESLPQTHWSEIY